MATINYAKEWARMATRLEWMMIRMQKLLESAQQDDERAPILAKMATVQAQIDHARAQANRYTPKRDTSA